MVCTLGRAMLWLAAWDTWGVSGGQLRSGTMVRVPLFCAKDLSSTLYSSFQGKNAVTRRRVDRWEHATPLHHTELVEAGVIPGVALAVISARLFHRNEAGGEAPAERGPGQATELSPITLHMPDGLPLMPDGLPDGNAQPVSTLTAVAPAALPGVASSSASASYVVPPYDPKLFPTVAEPKTTGPLGYWKRLSIPSIELGPDGPAKWWPQLQDSSYLMHNIIKETEAYDFSFNRGAIRTQSMQEWMHKLTNQLRREGVVKCAVAFSQFLQAQLPDAEWWLEGGSLIGAIRAPHEFIPWCVRPFGRSA